MSEEDKRRDEDKARERAARIRDEQEFRRVDRKEIREGGGKIDIIAFREGGLQVTTGRK